MENNTTIFVHLFSHSSMNSFFHSFILYTNNILAVKVFILLIVLLFFIYLFTIFFHYVFIRLFIYLVRLFVYSFFNII